MNGAGVEDQDSATLIPTNSFSILANQGEMEEMCGRCTRRASRVRFERQGNGVSPVAPGQRKRPHSTSTPPKSLQVVMSHMLRMFTDMLKHDH